MTATRDVILKLENLEVCYGTIAALKGVSLEVKKGELVAVIGSNGAGKTTMLKAISGILHPVNGRILFDGTSIVGISPHKVTALGVAHSPEGRRIFANQSVEDNLLLGAYPRFGKENRREIDNDKSRIFEIFPRLFERRGQVAGTLSGGEQQMLALGRAMMLKPKLLLLDEPSMGLAPIIIDEVFKVIEQLRDAGEVTILLVEQLAFRALKVANNAYVLEQGKVRLSGSGVELLGHPEVRRAYLGARAKSKSGT